ncbi:Baeyer-Villiger monooxygenase [Talaromyces pinophilus]|nr:Baeyer-Villiger monooxygenase [Talaromyces pinophilus]
MGSTSEIAQYDALIVGAGFGGYSMLPRLRSLGLRVKLYERGSGPGGVWFWNQYPGARVDSDAPVYQLFDRELWEDFTFSERFPSWQELQRYFAHVEKKWDLRKDIEYCKNVESADWDSARCRWLITCSDGTETECKWLILSVGSSSKMYIPNIKGSSEFQGELYHTAHWPHYDVILKNKRIAVIGTGASGIQVIQEAGKHSKRLTVYQRTPNLCLPMVQRKLDPVEEQKKKETGVYAEAFKKCESTAGGVTYERTDKNTFDDTPEEREKFYQSLVKDGGLRFWVAGYKDMMTDQKANDAAYDFWRRMVLKRINNPAKGELLAPEVPPHPYGAKRPSLEQNYFEVMDQDNVDIVDVNRFPIEEINATGLKTAAGQVDVDIIIFATGFDALTGGLMDIQIRGTDGRTLMQHWADGVKTSIGIAVPKFPNMFYLFGPQAPSTFSNGPSCIQSQARWLAKLVEKLETDKIKSFEATEASADEWLEMVRDEWDATLFSKGKISLPALLSSIHVLTACTAGGRARIFQERKFNP